jgi:arginine deiminase
MFKTYEDLHTYLKKTKDLGHTLSFLRIAVEKEGEILDSMEDAQEHYLKEINYFMGNEDFIPTPMTFMGYRRKPKAWAVAKQIKEYKCRQQDI